MMLKRIRSIITNLIDAYNDILNKMTTYMMIQPFV